MHQRKHPQSYSKNRNSRGFSMGPWYGPSPSNRDRKYGQLEAHTKYKYIRACVCIYIHIHIGIVVI